MSFGLWARHVVTKEGDGGAFTTASPMVQTGQAGSLRRYQLLGSLYELSAGKTSSES